MITITFLYFAHLRDLFQKDRESIEVPQETSLREALQKLWTEKKQKSQSIPPLRMAIHEEYVRDEYKLQETCEVLLIPPVSGG